MGGSGGGGGSGKIGYPEYIEVIHNNWLTHVADTPTESMADLMNAAFGNSPWSGLSAYDPDADITAYEAAITAFAAILAGITDTTNWAALFTQAATSVGSATALVVADLTVADEAVADEVVADGVAVGDAVVADGVAVGDLSVADMAAITGISEAVILADVSAFANQLDDEILTKVLPRFRRGMQDINAVVSSAFPIGQSIIESFRDREVAKHTSGLRYHAADKNAELDLAVVSANLTKDVEVGRANLLKDVQVSGANLSKDTQIGAANLTKDIQISGADLVKDTQIGQANLSKDVSISGANLAKDVSVGGANLTKDVQVGDITVKTDAEYERMYLEGSSQMLRLMLQRIAWEEGYMRTVVEGKRIKIIAKKEETDMDAQIDARDAVWDLSTYQYGANLLAAPGGGTVLPESNKPSQAQSAIGGALSGAAAGAVASGGNPLGALAGGLLGAASAFL